MKNAVIHESAADLVKASKHHDGFELLEMKQESAVNQSRVSHDDNDDKFEDFGEGKKK